MSFREYKSLPQEAGNLQPRAESDNLVVQWVRAVEHADSAYEALRGVQAQLEVWETTLRDTEASLASPDVSALLKQTRMLHELHRRAVKDFGRAMKDLDELKSAFSVLQEANPIWNGQTEEV
jgi:hypothetical protein